MNSKDEVKCSDRVKTLKEERDFNRQYIKNNMVKKSMRDIIKHIMDK